MLSEDPDFSFEILLKGDENSKNLRNRIMKAQRFQRLTKRFLNYFNEMGVLEEL